jgi:hypothetical protein
MHEGGVVATTGDLFALRPTRLKVALSFLRKVCCNHFYWELCWLIWSLALPLFLITNLLYAPANHVVAHSRHL